MSVDLIPEEFKTVNNLHEKIKYDKNGNGWIYMEIHNDMYGVPQPRILANKYELFVNWHISTGPTNILPIYQQ